jgi:EAL domain-containing protein (putative c-di-GMP-specific phosphodiesterase class I)
VSQMPPLVQERPRYLAAGLESALAASDQLSLVYQPRINLRSHACASAEALLRWTHPVLGPVPPAEFIPIAEQTGMMGSVTAWVIDRALADLRRWTEIGFRNGVSINVSALNLSEKDFVDRLWETIARRGVDPERVELEFTEGASLRDAPRVRETMAELVGIGVRVSIDDFGAGHSNLSYLRDLPASTLKIDRSFVRSLGVNPRDQIIVRSVIALAHALEYHVVAEGIEDASTLALLAAWGCDEGQGYHISRPMPPDALLSWLGGR